MTIVGWYCYSRVPALSRFCRSDSLSGTSGKASCSGILLPSLGEHKFSSLFLASLSQQNGLFCLDMDRFQRFFSSGVSFFTQFFLAICFFFGDYFLTPWRMSFRYCLCENWLLVNSKFTPKYFSFIFLMEIFLGVYSYFSPLWIEKSIISLYLDTYGVLAISWAHL